MKNVSILIKTECEKYDGRLYYSESLNLFVDGELIAEGYYGGEPEDNCRIRDYLWVEKALATLAEKLGAKVSITEERN